MLSALDLDFRPSPARWPLLGVLLLLIGVAGALYAYSETRALNGQISLAQARVESMTQGVKPKAAPTLDSETLQTEVRAANVILQQLALPWNDLFVALETTSDKQIALLSIQPDASKQIVRIAGEAKSFEALLSYMRRIEQSKTLRQVYLNSHEVRLQDAEKPIRFALTASWAVQP